MSNSMLLIEDQPLQLLPQLAKAVGLNEAVVLQQIQFWVKSAEKRRDERHWHGGCWWVWNNYEDWQRDNFPFWSTRTIQRTVLELEAKGLLISAQPNGQDRTKWYRINYDKLAESIVPSRRVPPCQPGTIEGDNLAPSNTTDRHLPSSRSETLSESLLNPSRGGPAVHPSKVHHLNLVDPTSVPEAFPFDEFWAVYPRKVDKKTAEELWGRMPVGDREAVMKALPNYLQSCDDAQRSYRDPATFLNPKKKFWEGFVQGIVDLGKRKPSPPSSGHQAYSDDSWDEVLAKEGTQ